MSEAAKEQISLEQLLETAKVAPEAAESTTPLIDEVFNLAEEKKADDAQRETDERVVSGLAALIYNCDTDLGLTGKGQVQHIISKIDDVIGKQINEVIHHPDFKEVEANWRGLAELVENTDFKAGVELDVLDVTKDELMEDFEDNAVDITGSALFDKIYFKEYDQYGGHPFGAMVGLYEFANTPDDRTWLSTMGKIANAAHTPFTASVSPKFFGCDNVAQMAEIKDLGGMLSQPKYAAWNKMRKQAGSAYLGLTLPKYIARLPYDKEVNPCRNLDFVEDRINDKGEEQYLWASSAYLFAQNLIKSYVQSGWCQYLRGPKGGGLVEGLSAPTFTVNGQSETKIPVEIVIPDYRELEFANAGFMPLVYRKNSADACFFSCQSLKAVEKFKDANDSEDSQLIANISYTFSITRIAHYVKCMMRDNIGTTADATYIQQSLSSWISQYVTTVTDPDDLTLRTYPFKAANIEVNEKPGLIGWYDCKISVKPHYQFEGLDVELKLDSRL